MTSVVIIALLLLAFALASMTYVYAFRGEYRHPSLKPYLRKCWPMFAPLNCLLYMATERRAARPLPSLEDFPELAVIRDNWETIRSEALGLYENQEFDRIKTPGNEGYYDVGFHTFFKSGWSKYYLKWYGYTHHSGQRSCPRTVELLEGISSVKGALFTLLPPGGKLRRHSDPFACSLRYHLGLATPNSDDCWIEVDGQKYSWRDGEAFLFDETYVHHAANETDQYRLILMCDVARPMNLFGRLVNWVYCQFMRLTIVPNDSSDRAGGINALFSGVAPMLEKGKQLKKTNRPLYKLIKNVINLVALLLVIALLAAVVYLPYQAITG
ncbi:MAG: aspartyl/asparaginyl beta-hydroxylase domain-containing protein [Gammaproteobacteria bacterium]|nr:aspartyl/asparaginyl beta-hydroxylase domain-containing protein [Gammaproteobacteria bacterium]